jgi:hypothetical protein
MRLRGKIDRYPYFDITIDSRFYAYVTNSSVPLIIKSRIFLLIFSNPAKPKINLHDFLLPYYPMLKIRFLVA